MTKLLRDGSFLALFSLFIPLDFYLSDALFNSNDDIFPFCLRKSNPLGLPGYPLSCSPDHLIRCWVTPKHPLLLVCIFLQHCFRITGAQRVGRQRAEQGQACCTAQALGLSCIFGFPQHPKDLARAEDSDAEVAVLALSAVKCVKEHGKTYTSSSSVCYRIWRTKHDIPERRI